MLDQKNFFALILFCTKKHHKIKYEEKMIRVLFLDVENSTRSIMAEALLNHMGKGTFAACSAGSSPSGRIDPRCIKMLNSHGIDVAPLYSKSWNNFITERFDLIICVSERLEDELWPLFKGRPKQINWHIPNPAENGQTPEEIITSYDLTYLTLVYRVEELIDMQSLEGDVSGWGRYESKHT